MEDDSIEYVQVAIKKEDDFFKMLNNIDNEIEQVKTGNLLNDKENEVNKWQKDIKENYKHFMKKDPNDNT